MSSSYVMQASKKMFDLDLDLSREIISTHLLARG